MLATLKHQDPGKAAISIIAAYVLVFQALLAVSARSAGAAAALTQGHDIICSEHAVGSIVPAPVGQDHHDSQCCILHCMGLDRMVPAADSVALPYQPAVVGAVIHPWFLEPALRTYGCRPLGARAPPILT